MADYPKQLERERIRAQDEGSERGFFARLSPQAKRLRFLKFVDAPNETLVHFFTHIDYDRHMAFVCEHDGRLVGEARYVANPDARSCEFGVVIADEWHHTGIARLLMEVLIDAARERGFETMEGLVLRSNTAMLGFAQALGFELEPEPYERSVVRVVKKLRVLA